MDTEGGFMAFRIVRFFISEIYFGISLIGFAREGEFFQALFEFVIWRDPCRFREPWMLRLQFFFKAFEVRIGGKGYGQKGRKA